MEKRPQGRARLPLARMPQRSYDFTGEGARDGGGGAGGERVGASVKAGGEAGSRSYSAFLAVNTLASAAALLSLSGCGYLGLGGDPIADKPATQTPAPPPTGATNLVDKTTRDVDTCSKRVNEALAAQLKAGPGATTQPASGLGAVTPVEVKTETAVAAATSQPATMPAATQAIASTQAAPPSLLSPTSSAAAMGTLSVAPGQTPVADASISDLMGLLRQRAQANPRQLNYALAELLLEAAESNKAPDPTTVSFLPPNDQKLLTDLVASVQALAASTPAQGSSLAERAAPLLATAQGWQAQADLKLPRLVLASRVDSFGVFTPVESKFPNGKRSTVIIYCEVANFESQKAAGTGEDAVFLTHLTQQDTLITDDGLLVWRPNPEDIEDRSHNLRHDFYLVKKLTLPDTLPIGKYTLRMTVTDKLSNKIAMTSLPIEITAK